MYPRLNVATLYFSLIISTRYSTWGVFPVPPTVILPMEMMGILNPVIVDQILIIEHVPDPDDQPIQPGKGHQDH